LGEDYVALLDPSTITCTCTKLQAG
jgi:hypothetical protein